MNKSYSIKTNGFTYHSKVWNRSMIVRANGHAYSLMAFYLEFRTAGLERLFKYVSRNFDDNLRVRINGVSVYVHFK